jgi:hypothetical protein
MKNVQTIIAAVLIISATASATVYNDDFESYPVGYDIADSPDWTDEFTVYGDSFVVSEISANKYVTVDDGSISPVYGYTTPGIIADSRISYDFMFTGDDTDTSAVFRLNDSVNPGYIVTCCNGRVDIYGIGDYVMIGHNLGENGFAWSTVYFLGDYFEIDTWYHIDAMLLGYPEVYFNVSVNDDLNYTGTLDHYQTETGYCGICNRRRFAGSTYVDNFEVDDDPVITGIKSASLGEIKASFR